MERISERRAWNTVPAYELIGKNFGKWFVLDRSPGKPSRCLCRCECGTVRWVAQSSLRQGISRDCGCGRRASIVSRNFIDGRCQKRLHSIWRGMKKRCLYPTFVGWKNYGGRGITICERWMDFANFHADMGEPPSPAHSIDRINNDGNYEPSNCRWATPKEQAANKRKRQRV